MLKIDRTRPPSLGLLIEEDEKDYQPIEVRVLRTGSSCNGHHVSSVMSYDRFRRRYNARRSKS